MVRKLVLLSILLCTSWSIAGATPSTEATLPAWSYPIGASGKPLGDGFVVRHVFQSENTWYNPGWWHTAEDWYAQEGDTAGAQVYAVADGMVVYAGSNYPGRVVIIRHAADLFSMYGHLDPALAIEVNQRVARGDLLGSVLRRSDRVPNHLHFEIRTFLTTRPVNGAAPRYRFRCGVNCPPGPGYWPMRDRQLPSALGWRNPTHVITGRAFAGVAAGQLGNVVVATRPPTTTIALWSAPPNGSRTPRQLGTAIVVPGQQYGLLGVWAGPEDSQTTSAEGYQVWYNIRLSASRSGWVQAVQPAFTDTGSDGRPSSVVFTFLPAVMAKEADS